MSVADELNQICDEFIQACQLSTLKTFRKRVKDDADLKKAYEGRELFELLQNADDAWDVVGSKKSKVVIELTDDSLIVKNNGKPFDKDSINSLCQGNASTKLSQKYIGCKGIGFRSVLNCSDEIRIYSGQGEDCYSVCFSKEFAAEKYDLIRCLPHIKQEVLELQQRGINPEMPILAVPKYIPAKQKEFDTEIYLVLKPEEKVLLYNKIKSDIDAFNKNVLLFLPHISEIEFRVEGNVIEYLCASNDCDETLYTVNKKRNGILVESESFYLYPSEQEITFQSGEKKSAKFAIGIPVEESAFRSCLYTFFPVLNIASPLPALLHGTFHLTPNRNSLDADYIDENTTVFKEMLNFYVKTVVEHFEGPRRLALLKPADFLKSINFFDGVLGKMIKGDPRSPKTEEMYVSLCADKNVFFTVIGGYLNASDNPVICEFDPPLQLKKEPFDKIVQFIADENLRKWAQHLIKNNAKDASGAEEYLRNKINSVSAEWNAEERARVFKWWNKSGYLSLPNLLKYRAKPENLFLNSQAESCFLSGSITDVPTWAKIYVLAEADEAALLSAFKDEIINERKSSTENEKRILPRCIKDKLLSLHEQSSRAEMISPVNNSVNKNYDYAIEFVQWLWKIWKEDSFADTVRALKFNLPTVDGLVQESSKVYLGRDYGNEIGSAFFSDISSLRALANVELDGSPSTWEKQDFFVALGVNLYPKVELEEFGEIDFNLPDVPAERKKLYNFIVEYWNKISALFGGNGVTCFRGKIHSIANIHSILENSGNKKDQYLTILKWISLDHNLKSLLSSNKETREAYIEYKPRIKGQKNFIKIAPIAENACPSFLHYLFSKTPWIPLTEGKYYAPEDIIINDDDTLKFFGRPCLTERDLDDIHEQIGCSKDELRQILIDLGAKKSLLDLDSTTFYQILMELPTKNGSEKISRELYRAIIENGKAEKDKKTAFFDDSARKRQFFENGKVLAKNRTGAKSVYKLAKEVYFSSSAVLNFDDDYFIDVPSRSGQKDDFKNILNVRPFEQKYEVLETSLSVCNDDFQKDFADFLPYLMVYRQGKKDYTKEINILLVRTAKIEWNGQHKIIAGDYQLLKKNSTWFICVGEESVYNNLQKEKIADALEQVFNVVLNFPAREFLNRINQLFIYTKEQRKHLIETDFGSTEEYERTRDEIVQSESLRVLLKDRLREDSLSAVEIETLIDNIDWYNLSSYSSQKKLSELLRKIEKDVEYLKSFMNKDVSLFNYNCEEFQKVYETEEDALKLEIYNRLKPTEDKWKELKKDWSSLDAWVERYKEEEKNGKLNSAYFDADKALKSIEVKFFENFGERASDATTSMGEIKEIYRQNMDKLRKIETKNKSNIHAFTNEIENDSLMYFVTPEKIEELFKEFIKEKGLDSVKKEGISLEQMSSLLEATKIDICVKKGSPKKLGGHSSKKTTVSEDPSAEENKKISGGIAEYLVILKLAQQEFDYVNKYFDKTGYDIIWKSGYAKDMDRIPQDTYDYDVTQTDDKAGYDIELVSKSDKQKKMYIEVKSSASEGCSFIMSANEYTKAKELEKEKSQYRLAFVTGSSKGEPHIAIIPDKLTDESLFKPITLQYNIVYMGDGESKESEGDATSSV